MNEHIRALLAKRWVLPTATGVVGAAIGALVGYKFTKAQYDRIEAKMAEIEEITGTIEEFEHPELEFNTPAEEMKNYVMLDAQRATDVVARHPSASHEHEIPMVPELRKIGTVTSINQKEDGSLEVEGVLDKRPGTAEKRVKVDLSPLEEVDPVKAGEALVKNIFHKDDTAGDEWDYKTEIEARSKKAPYILHVDEYINNELEYDQQTVTWYEKDEILADERDTPMYNWKEVLGELRFGHGSNDGNVVFIRNDGLATEYEVLRDPGSYQEIVLGEELESEAQEQELKHSAVLKMRRD